MIGGVGDERNAPLVLAVEADMGRGAITLPRARLYLLDENNKIKVEHVNFYAASADDYSPIGVAARAKDVGRHR